MIPYIMENKKMFETTNQVLYVWAYLLGIFPDI